jgi:hypothetical protein
MSDAGPLAAVTGVSVSPSVKSLGVSETQDFTETVTGGTGLGVTWSLSAAVGAIDANGLYTAPATSPTQPTVTVRATSVEDPTKYGEAIVTLLVTVVDATPATVTLNEAGTQQFAATVSGPANQAVTWSRSPAIGALSPTGLYTAPPTLAFTQDVTVTAASVAEPGKTDTCIIHLVARSGPISVDVSPATATLSASQQQQCTETVTGDGLHSVTWSRSPAVGWVFQNGLYVAPSTIASQTTVTITATSDQDGSKTDTCVITLLVSSTAPAAGSLRRSGFTSGIGVSI